MTSVFLKHETFILVISISGISYTVLFSDKKQVLTWKSFTSVHLSFSNTEHYVQDAEQGVVKKNSD